MRGERQSKQAWPNRPGAHPRKSRRRSSTPTCRPLRFEPLEDRRLLALVTVDTLEDEDDGITEGGISLRDAIADANPGDTIDFVVEGTIQLKHGELLINKDLSIVGPGADRLTIDARGGSRVFNVDDGNSGTQSEVNIGYLTITGGNTLADGGGILNRETLLVSGCYITGNSAEDGGGIGNFGGTFIVGDSTISQNTAFGALGGGGGIFSFANGKAALSIIDSSTISNNVSTSRGGGVYNFEGTIDINFSTITDNDAPANQGSGIAALGDTLRVATQLVSTIVAGNVHSDVDVVVGFQPTFASSGYNLIGSGTSTGSFGVLGDQVIGTADPLLGPLTDNGGAMPTHLPLVGSPAIDTGDPDFAVPPLYDQRLAPHDRVFDGNGDSVARIDKGAVERDVVLFEVSTLDDEDDPDFSVGDFSLREAIGQAGLLGQGTPTIVFASALTSGGPATIALSLGQLTITRRMHIVGPGAELLTIDAQQGSRVFNVDDEDGPIRIEVMLSGLTLTGGYDAGGGGAIFSQERLTLRDSVLTGNTAQWGGGVYNGEFGRLTVERSLITGNHAIEPVPGALGSGGGLYAWSGRVDVLESTISGNDSVTHGGGVLIANNADVRIIGSAIRDNIAAENGGGIHNGDGNLTVQNSTISGNHAELGGGLLVVTPNFRTTTISNSTISGNVAPLGGGGANNLSGQLHFEFCTITENVANDFAGSGVLSSPSEFDSPTSFYSSIIAYNFAPGDEPGAGKLDVAVSGAFNSLISLGYNIVGIGGFVDETFDEMGDQIIGTDDPLLGPLADHGGPTLTHALLSGSPALDRGQPSSAPGVNGVPKYDQRGAPYSRVRDGDPPASIVIDVGAFEAQAIPPALPGDYNLDEIVDAADYVVWRNGLGSNVLAYSGADGNGDSAIDERDLAVWQASFGKALAPAAGGGAGLETAGVEARRAEADALEVAFAELTEPHSATRSESSAGATFVRNVHVDFGPAAPATAERDGRPTAARQPVTAEPTGHALLTCLLRHEVVHSEVDELPEGQRESATTDARSNSDMSAWDVVFTALGA